MDKQQLRQFIIQQKGMYPKDDLVAWSQAVQKKIEALEVFQQSHTILLYHSLPDEVQTGQMLAQWHGIKKCILPQVIGDDLALRIYEGENNLKKGNLGIWESVGDIYDDLAGIDLVIVPGLAFDKECHRLGRGKGYYDRLLKKLSAPTLGVCFDFQLVDKVPTESHDVSLDMLLTPSAVYHR